MKSLNQKLYEAAMAAINALYSDQSVSRTTARENLQGLRDEIDMLLDTLK